MKAPAEHPGIFAEPPVKLVVAQLRFERHEEVREPAFARRFSSLVGEGFSSIEQANVRQITASPAGVVAEDRESGWAFQSESGEKFVILESSAAYESTAYAGWDAFRSQLLSLLDAVEDSIQPATEQRIGLRYIDQLSTPDGVAARWHGFVRDEVLGPLLHSDLGGDVTSIEQRVVFAFGDGSSCLLRHGYSLDPQLQGGYLLDTDVSRETKAVYDRERVRASFEEFHARSKAVFFGCLTDEYLEQLRLGADIALA